MATTLPDLTSMRTLHPMFMRIHTGIIVPIITPIDWEVRHNQRLETAILVHAHLMPL